MDIKERKRFTESLDRVTCLLMDGLQTDGGHHKQWYLEEALHELTGDKFYRDAKQEFEWEGGLAP